MARSRWAAGVVVLGGLLMTVLFVPFTVAHGPTSINRGDEVLSADMQVWGLLLGVVPCVVLGLALWRLRDLAAGARAVTRAAWAAVAVLLVLSAAQDLAFRALGPPFVYFVMVPALLVAAASHRSGVPGDPAVRIVTALLSLVLLRRPGLNGPPGGVRGRVGQLPDCCVPALRGGRGLAWAALGVALARVSTDDGLTARVGDRSAV